MQTHKKKKKKQKEISLQLEFNGKRLTFHCAGPDCPLCCLSGCLLVCGLPDLVVRREFHYVGLKRTWAEAQRYCREKFSDLATIQSSGNLTEARTAAGSANIWIGLFNGTWKWSQAEEQDDSPSTWFTNWNIFEPTSEKCVTLGKDGKWSSKDCQGLYYSVCYNGESEGEALGQRLIGPLPSQ